MKIIKPKSVSHRWIPLETEDSPDDNASFYVRTLTRPELRQLEDHLFTPPYDTTRVLTAEGERLAVRLGLLDWRNVQDEDGNVVMFSGIWQEVFEFLPPIIVKLLAYEIFMGSMWTEEDEKKSLPRSKSSATETPSTATNVT